MGLFEWVHLRWLAGRPSQHIFSEIRIVVRFILSKIHKTVSMTRIAGILALLMLWVVCFLGAAQSSEDNIDISHQWDWLGVGPIYSFGSMLSTTYPYYSYYQPTYSIPWPYKEPFYYYPPSYIISDSTYPWWIGTHKDLTKTMEIARSGSSMRVYSNGIWQTL